MTNSQSKLNPNKLENGKPIPDATSILNHKAIDTREICYNLDSQMSYNTNNKNKPINLKEIFRFYLHCLPIKDRLYLAFAIITLFTSSTINLITPKLLGMAVDISTGNHPSHNSIITKFLYSQTTLKPILFAFAFGALSSWMRVYFSELTLHGMQIRCRKMIFSSIMNRETENLQKDKSGEFVTLLLQDVETAAQLATTCTFSLLRSLNSAVGGSLMLFMLSPKLTFLSLSLAPSVGVLAVLYSKFAKRLSGHLRDKLSNSIDTVAERFNTFLTVKMFGQEKREIENFARRLDSMYSDAKYLALVNGGFMGGLGFAINSSLLAILFFGGLLVKKNELSLGNLTSFALYSSMVGLGFSGLSRAWGDLSKSIVSTEKIVQLARNNQRIDEGNVTLDNVKGEITFENVSFSYPSQPNKKILTNVSFIIPPGKIVAFAGVSGIGKTTITKLIIKLYKPTSGRILLDGVDIATLNTSWLRQKVFSIVNQEPTLFSMTIAENITYGLEVEDDKDIADKVRNAAISANAYDFIDNLPEKFETLVYSNYCNLSVGQKQRVAIARAILKDTPCLVLDEATSSLDGGAEKVVEGAIRRLMEGRSVIMISHKKSSLKFSDEIFFLDQGNIVERGSFDELMNLSDGFLRKLHLIDSNVTSLES